MFYAVSQCVDEEKYFAMREVLLKVFPKEETWDNSERDASMQLSQHQRVLLLRPGTLPF